MNSGDQRQAGVIKTWDDEKGYGFIELPGSRKDVFFHISSVETSRSRPHEGDEVIYILEPGSDKRPRVEAVWLRGDPPLDESNLHRGMRTGFIWRLLAIPAYAALLLALEHALDQTVPILFWILAASAVCFALFGQDKSLAWKGKRRIPETALLTWSLIGGWPGGLLAQAVFWHKTTKKSFQISFWGAAALNAMATSALALMLKGALPIL